MERNRLVLLAISALIAIYGAVTYQLFFLAMGVFLMVLVVLPVITRRGQPVGEEPAVGDAEVSADIKNLKASVGPVDLDRQRIEDRLEGLEKK
jgi:hypothetical protein